MHIVCIVTIGMQCTRCTWTDQSHKWNTCKAILGICYRSTISIQFKSNAFSWRFKRGTNNPCKRRWIELLCIAYSRRPRWLAHLCAFSNLRLWNFGHIIAMSKVIEIPRECRNLQRFYESLAWLRDLCSYNFNGTRTHSDHPKTSIERSITR